MLDKGDETNAIKSRLAWYNTATMSKRSRTDRRLQDTTSASANANTNLVGFLPELVMVGRTG